MFFFIPYAVGLPLDSNEVNKDDLVKAKEKAILTLGATLSKYGFAEGMN